MERKVVLITGASNGLGAGLARDFAQEGYSVVINYCKSKRKAEALVGELRSNGYDAVAIFADVSNAEDVESMVNDVIEIFGHIDILINNAGVASNCLLIDESESSIEKTIFTNLIGTINCTKAVCKHMISRQNGKIINISSIWGRFGASMESVYSASKGGINAFTKAMAKELAYSHINVNAIAPGVVDTNMMKSYTDKELEEIKSNIPLGRFLTAKDISPLALFLASDLSEAITGQIIQIDGGFTL